jgi:tetratricopeptide (TPR) repeat protein
MYHQRPKRVPNVWSNEFTVSGEQYVVARKAVNNASVRVKGFNKFAAPVNRVRKTRRKTTKAKQEPKRKQPLFSTTAIMKRSLQSIGLLGFASPVLSRLGSSSSTPLPSILETTARRIADTAAPLSSSRLLVGDEEGHQFDVRGGFQIFFASFLGLIVLVRVCVSFLLIKHRGQASLRLAQPTVLQLLIGAGSLAIASCFLLLPTSDTHCRYRCICLMVPLTVAGNTLACRVWRISLLMTPILQLGKAEDRAPSRLRHLVMHNMTFLAEAVDVLAAICCCCWLHKDTNSRRRSNRRLSRGTTLRQKVPLSSLLRLVFLLTLPQIFLQVLGLTVPCLGGELQLRRGAPSCGYKGAGSLLTAVSIGVCLFPYMVAAYLSLHSQHLPAVFNEAEAFLDSFKVFCVVFVVLVPSIILTDNPEARVWLTTCGVFSLVMPPCWHIVYPKLINAVVSGEGSKSQRGLGKLLQRDGNLTMLQVRAKKDGDSEKATKLALTIGKMYEDMGLIQKSICLFDEALTVWECDPLREKKKKVGGFTHDEINALSSTDLEFIIQLLIAKGRVNGTFNSAQNTGQRNAAKAWLDALEIYESAPASIHLRDCSIIFPIFSGLFVFLKGDKIQQDSKSTLEQNIVRKFVRETRLHADPVHYTRALAMQCETKGRLGKYKAAMESFTIMQSIYDPDEHSAGIATAYGTDRSAQAFAQRALWLDQLGETEQSLEACEYVVRVLMPLMDPTNVLNSFEMLLPVIRILKPRGQEKRMRDLFDEYVVQNFNKHFGKGGITPCLPIFKPMLMLLDICHDEEGFPHFEEAVEWLLEGQNGVPPDFLDSVFSKLCWSPSSLVAELCLRFARKMAQDGFCKDRITCLLLKGVSLAHTAERKLKNRGGRVILPIAYQLHQPVFEELLQMATAYDIPMERHEDLTASHSSGSGISAHLPSYEHGISATSSDGNCSISTDNSLTQSDDRLKMKSALSSSSEGRSMSGYSSSDDSEQVAESFPRIASTGSLFNMSRDPMKTPLEETEKEERS